MKLYSFPLPLSFYRSPELPTCTGGVRISFVEFCIALLWVEDQTRSPLMVPFNMKYRDFFLTSLVLGISCKAESDFEGE